MCKEIKPSIILLYERFPNNIKVVDCTNVFEVTTILTKYNVDKNKMPTILTFKSGIFSKYDGYTEYTDLEDFLLKIMSTRKTTTSTDQMLTKL